MQQIHLPTLGARYWAALCLASIFGANMGDFFARNLGLGHVAGLPFLALALAIVIASERFDRSVHQVYYWTAIIIVRTGATNFADFACGDMKLPRGLVIIGLAVALVVALLPAGDSPGGGGQAKTRRSIRCFGPMPAIGSACSLPAPWVR
jgi:uncharacterized membrane-anchored protein